VLRVPTIRAIETREAAAPSSWDLMVTGVGLDTDAGVLVSPYLAENLSAVFACVQIIAETVATLPVVVYRRAGDGRAVEPQHPVARLFADQPNERQTAPEFIEQLTAHCLLRGNAYAEIRWDARGAPAELIPLHPDSVAVLRVPGTRRIVYEVADPDGGTRRLLPEQVLHLKDRTDDGVVGRSRLSRARETFATAIATERFAASTYKNGAALTGVLQTPEAISDATAARLRTSFDDIYKGSGNAGKVAVLEESLTFKAISVSPADAEMLASRRLGVENICRIFRVPAPIAGDLTHATYSNITELNRTFTTHTLSPWLTRWEAALRRSLLSAAARQNYLIEFDTDLLLRGDMLTRFQSYRIGREVGLYSANDLRRFENLNPRTDAEADVFLAPLNMNPEQAGQAKG